MFSYKSINPKMFVISNLPQNWFLSSDAKTTVIITFHYDSESKCLCNKLLRSNLKLNMFFCRY